MNPVGFWVFHVGRNVVMHVHILSLKVVPCIFHSPTLLLSQCTSLLLNLWLLFIYLLVLFSGVGRLFYQIFYPKIINYKGEVDCPTFVCP